MADSRPSTRMEKLSHKPFRIEFALAGPLDHVGTIGRALAGVTRRVVDRFGNQRT